MRLLFRSTLIVLIACFGMSIQGAIAQDGSERNTIDEIVAVVGDEVVLRSDVDGLVANVAQQQGTSPTDELWMQALSELINQEVLAAKARQDTLINVSDEQVEQAMDRQLNQMIQQVGGEAQLEQLYGASMIQIREELREDFRKQMLATEMRRKITDRIRITPSEVRTWFEQFDEEELPELPDMVRLAHIVRYPVIPESAEEEAREIITAIRDSIVAGATIEEMAQRFSDDPGSAQLGGRYNDAVLGDLVPEFGAVAARLSEGELSEPFRTPFGYHVMRLNERQGDRVDFNHVLIRVDESRADPQPAMEYLSAVRDSIVNQGRSFSAMARRHSEEERSSSQGGRILDPNTGERDLALERLSSRWQQTIRALEPGEISQPREVDLLDGRRAVHILLLQDFIPAHVADFETDYERIRNFALQEKQQRELNRRMEALRDEIHVALRGKAARLQDELPDDVMDPDSDLQQPTDPDVTPMNPQEQIPPESQPSPDGDAR